MTETEKNIPENIQKHLQYMVSAFGLNQDEETLDNLAESWSEKLEAFDSEMIEMGMDELETFVDDGAKEANPYLTREYRKPFVVPEQVYAEASPGRRHPSAPGGSLVR